MTQLFLLLLLWLPNAAGLAMVADVAKKMLDALVPVGAAGHLGVPQWLLTGQAFMVAVTVLVGLLQVCTAYLACWSKGRFHSHGH